MMWSWIALILSSVILGSVVTLLVQFYFLQKYFYRQQSIDNEPKLSSKPFHLPESIIQMVRASESTNTKEGCAALNILFQFLFHELRDTARVRRWFRNKLTVEFEELLTRTAIGRIIGSIKVRDISLGSEFPVIDNIVIDEVKINEKFSHVDSLDLKLDLSYKGGFRLVVDANMLLGKAAYLSIKVGELYGMGRLQFTRMPYSHWSFSFYEEPRLELEVESQFQGRPLPQITTLISNQIRKSVRKKHTLPNFKLRYKPFFSATEESFTGSEVAPGILNVTLHHLSRLLDGTPKDVYCLIGVESLPWSNIISCGPNTYYELDIIVTKKHSQPFGITFKQEFLGDRNKTCVVVDCSSQPEVLRGDVLISLDGRRVTQAGQVPKVLRAAAIQVTLRVERRVSDFAESYIRPAAKPESESDSSGSSSVSGSPAKQALKSDSAELKKTAQKHILGRLATQDVDLSNLPRLHTTKTVATNQIVLLDESVKLNVLHTDRYLNVVVRGVDETSVESTVGFINIPLSQIHTSPDTLHHFRLKPPDSFAASNSRNHTLSAQNGFIPLLCYGDILISAELTSCGTAPSPLRAESPTPFSMDTPSRPGSGEKRHEFQRTHLQSSMQCEFCGKKIWLKDAEQCKDCGMTCHKKCVAKCKSGTVCSGGRQHSGLSVLENITAAAVSTALDLAVDDARTSDQKSPTNPEIVMTTCADSATPKLPPTPSPAATNSQSSARKGLSGLLASVASAGRGLKRVGSAHNLQLPGENASGDCGSKSLPPSPQQTPVPSRKPSLPLELSEDMSALLDTLMQQGSDQTDMLDFAKNSGKTLYENLDLPQRKEKMQLMMNNLKIAIDTEAESRFCLTREKTSTKDTAAQAKMAFLIGKSDEKVQALTVLMLHLCAGLQHIQDLEEQERDLVIDSEGQPCDS